MKPGHWLAAHGARGILEPQEVPELVAGAERVLRLLADGAWHSAEEVRLAAGDGQTPASEGLRRLRDVRAALEATHEVVKAREEEGSRRFVYRLQRREPQGELFESRG